MKFLNTHVSIANAKLWFSHNIWLDCIELATHVNDCLNKKHIEPDMVVNTAISWKLRLFFNFVACLFICLSLESKTCQDQHKFYNSLPEHLLA